MTAADVRRPAPALKLLAGTLVLFSSASIRCEPEPLDLIDADVSAIHAAFAAGTLSAEQLIRAALQRIAEIDAAGPTLGSLITVNDEALAAAEALDSALPDKGRSAPLRGIPVVVKDNINTADLPTSGGSAALRGNEPFHDAFVVQRLREAGAIVIGKANLSELTLANGRPGYSSAAGQTLNAYNPRRSPSGSGVGPALAAGLAVLGVDTDTLGELRGTAAVSALVGIRPTLGLTSRAGVIPTALSLDVTGPVARSVRDAAILLGVIAGADPADPRTVDAGPRPSDDYLRYLDDQALKGARLGMPAGYSGGNREVDEAFRQALKTLKALGAEIIDVVLPDDLAAGWDGMLSTVVETEFRDQIDAYLINTEPGMPRDLAGLMSMSRSPLIAGSDTPMHPGRLAALQAALESPGLANLDYLDVLSERLPRARAAVAELMQQHGLDALVLPTMLCPAASLWEAYDTSYDCAVDDPSRPAYLASAAGLPEITLPMGYTREGLPLGLSLVGAAYREPRLLALAYAFEQAVRLRRPPELKPAPKPEPDVEGQSVLQ